MTVVEMSSRIKNTQRIGNGKVVGGAQGLATQLPKGRAAHAVMCLWDDDVPAIDAQTQFLPRIMAGQIVPQLTKRFTRLCAAGG